MTKIELSAPVKVAGVEVTTLTMSAPKVRDMLLMDKLGESDAEKEVRLLASLCEVEPSAIEDMALSDYRKMQEAYRGFLS